MLVIWPIANRFGKKNILFVGCIIALAGGLAAFVNVHSFGIVCLGVVFRHHPRPVRPAGTALGRSGSHGGKERLPLRRLHDGDLRRPCAHQKAQVLAEGGTWVDPAERARLEQEEADKEAEEARVQELEETCRRKGLDFAKENEKYLARREKQKNAPLGKLLGL